MSSSPATVEQLRAELRAFLGEDTFQQLLPAARLVMDQDHRLRYWQEKLIDRFFATRSGTLPRPSPAEVIAALRLCPAHHLPLQQSTVAVFRGCVDYTPAYLVIRNKHFPHSAVDPVSTEGSPFDGEECAIWICSECQVAATAYSRRMSWRAEPESAIDRYAQLKELGFDPVAIVRQLRQEFTLSIGEAKEIMIRCETGLAPTDYQWALLEPLHRAFADASLPSPEFELDDEVETVGEQHTYRRGFIRDRIWHYNFGAWHYYLTVDGKKVSKRYGPADLRKVHATADGPIKTKPHA